MFNSIVLLAGSLALASATVTFNPSTGVYTCPSTAPNGSFCASDAYKSNIIIRCSNGVGKLSNCNDELVSKFPQGASLSPCYQSSPLKGDAACSKNCVVYGSTSITNGTLPVPNCKPSATATPSSGPTPIPSQPAYSYSTKSFTSTGVSTYIWGSSSSTRSFTTTFFSTTSSPYPVNTHSVPHMGNSSAYQNTTRSSSSSGSTKPPYPTTLPTGGNGNSTARPSGTGVSTGINTSPSTGGRPSTNPPAPGTPGPTPTPSRAPATVPSNSALVNAVAPGLAAVGLFAAYFL